MKVAQILLLALGAFTGTSAVGQELGSTPQSGGLIESTSPQAPVPVETQHEDAHQLVVRVGARMEERSWEFDPVATKANLCDSDLDTRLGNVDHFLGRLRSPGAPRQEIRLWLKSASTGSDEFAWTSRLLLRDLEQMALTLPDPLKELSENLVLMEKLDGLMGLKALHLEGLMEAPSAIGHGGLEAWMESAETADAIFPMAKTPGQELMNLELRVSPSGARMRILEPPHFVGLAPTQGEGEGEQIWETELREYVGEDLAAILNEHPDLIRKLPFTVPGVHAVATAGLRLDILGVYTKELQPEICERFGLDGKFGLEIVRIEPGTIAQVLGVSPGSVVLEVCGRMIDSEGGIATALGGKIGSEVSVVWLDSTGRRQERTWRDGSSRVIIESFEIGEREGVPPAPRKTESSPADRK